MRMRTKAPADLHRVEPMTAMTINPMLIFIGAAAIILIMALLFNFMMEDYNLLLLKSI
jgi:hypothetical protein